MHFGAAAAVFVKGCLNKAEKFRFKTMPRITRWRFCAGYFVRGILHSRQKRCVSCPLRVEPLFGSNLGVFGMARKRHSDEDCLKILRQVELDLAGGADVAKACRSAGISDATYYTWRKKFGGMARSQLSELKALEKENQRLKKIVADLELDKLILKESLDFLKPKI